MGDTDGGLLQQFQLWRLLYDDGIVRHRSDLLRIDLVAHGKHKLQTLMLGQGSHNGAEDINPAIQDRAHRSVYQGLAGYSLPGEIHLFPALAIVEWAGVVVRRWPMRTFKVESVGDLSN